MQKINGRSNISNLVYTIIHWIIVVFLSGIAYVVQFSFLKDTGIEHKESFFYAKEVSINYLAYFIGTIIFLLGYYFVWKKYLRVDWNNYKEGSIGWKIVYFILMLIAMFSIFIVSIMVMFCYTGLSIYIVPEWTTWSCAVFPAYIFLVTIIDMVFLHRIIDLRGD